MSSPKIVRQLTEAAQQGDIPFTLSATGRYTGTDSDALTLVRGGVPTGVVSIPNRYMHSPSEMIDEADARACIDLIAAWVESVEEGEAFGR